MDGVLPGLIRAKPDLDESARDYSEKQSGKQGSFPLNGQ
jgi:hypothetical protein